MSTDTLFGAIGREIGALLTPVLGVVEDPAGLDELLASVGVVLPEANRQGLQDALTAVATLKADFDRLLQGGGGSFEELSALLNFARDILAAVQALDSVSPDVPALAGLGTDLLTRLLSSHLALKHPLLRSVLVLATLLQESTETDASQAIVQDGEVVRWPFAADRFRLERLGALLRDPVGLLEAEYGNALITAADATAMAGKLFVRIERVLRALRVSCRVGVGPEAVPLLGDLAPLLQDALIVFSDDKLAGASTQAGVALALCPAERGDLGLVMRPFGTLTSSRQLAGFTVSLGLTAGVDLLAWGRHGPTLLCADGVARVEGSLSAERLAQQGRPAFVVGSPDGTRLELGGAKLSMKTVLSDIEQTLSLAADVDAAALVLMPGDGDGFLASVLPRDGLRTSFALGLAWATGRGLSLRGGASLQADVPVGLSFAGLTMDHLHLGLDARDERLQAEVSANLSLAIGPVRAAVERLGLSAALTFPVNGGNLGPADLSLGLKPPSGIGLSIDAHGVLTGGGFLSHDAATGCYAGAMQVSLQGQLTLSAYGLLATRMPDGGSGYSLLVFITAEDFKPIPLGFGFMLRAIGGLLGVHRTFDAEAIKAGLKSDTLGTLLFPRDPVANATALLQAMAVAFPVRRDSYLLGLLVRITWFVPTLVQFDLALVAAVDAQVRLLALGLVSALLPTRDNDLIRLTMNAMGVLDFHAHTLQADAVLVGSRMLQFPITGSAALRARWTDSAEDSSGAYFVLAVGGVNPHFAPPAGFPALERVTMAPCLGQHLRLVCDAYFAISPNTLQFGSHIGLYAEAAGVSVNGDLGFDALITLLPPHFIVDFRASVNLKCGSRSLLMVWLEGALEGPLPLRLAAKASFKILWFSFSVHLDYTLSSGAGAAPLVPVVVLEDEVRKALAAPDSWSVRLNPGQGHGVALRGLPASAALVLDPLGQLVVQQQVAPLNTQRDITTYGGATVGGARRLQLQASLGGQAVAPLRAAFAPARYFAMSDDEKLAAPPFERMDAGAVVGDAAPSFEPSQVVAAPVVYQAVGGTPLASGAAGVQAAALVPQRALHTGAELQGLARTGAAARAPLRRMGSARFASHVAHVAPAATLLPTPWQIVPADGGLPLAPLGPAQTSWSEQRAALDRLNRGGAQWLMVPAHELAPQSQVQGA